MASGCGASALHTGLLWDHVPYPIDGQVLANRLIVYARLANAERRIRIDASELAHSRRERAQLRSNLTRSEEHTSELQSLMRISYAVFCLKKKKNKTTPHTHLHSLE